MPRLGLGKKHWNTVHPQALSTAQNSSHDSCQITSLRLEHARKKPNGAHAAEEEGEDSFSYLRSAGNGLERDLLDILPLIRHQQFQREIGKMYYPTQLLRDGSHEMPQPRGPPEPSSHSNFHPVDGSPLHAPAAALSSADRRWRARTLRTYNDVHSMYVRCYGSVLIQNPGPGLSALLKNNTALTVLVKLV